jgi:GxxExxY protein
MTEFQHKDLTERIIASAYEVHNVLGSGFLEKVYENAMVVELKNKGLRAEPQRGITVEYKGRIVGEYVTDIVVEDAVIVELKALDRIAEIHEIQLKNYLRATGIEVGLLINFGAGVEVRRKYVEKQN